MADCGISPVGCLKDIGQSIFTQCLWPPIKSHIDYWWCFDNNIQVLTDGIQDLERKIYDINQKIEDAQLRTEKIKPWVEEWSKVGTEKLGEARRILQYEINRRNLQDEINRILQDEINRRILQDDFNLRNLQDDIKRRILQDNTNSWDLISRYLMGKRAKKAVEDIAKHLDDENKFKDIADPPPPPAMGCTTDRSIMAFKSRNHIEEDIIKTLKDSSVSMIGICGMGGVGKTTMAKRIRERVMEEKENVFDEVVMVVVSQPIDMLKIQEAIADLLDLEFDKRSMAARADKLRKRLMDNKRKIVIFDDVWERFELEDLGVPSGFEGCKILLTSRSKYVCVQMEIKKIITMEILTEEEAWILFKEKAGNCLEDPTLLSVAKDVVAECKGLPIALVTVGKALHTQEKSIWVDSLSQLRQSNPADFPELLKDVYKPLKLSYDKLDNNREQLLFLLCCLFPEDYDIPVEELTLYFMGLQIFDDITHIEKARNRMHRLVVNLKSRFLLIDGEEKHLVKMHDVVRDVAIYIGSKEKECFTKSLNKISIENSSDINCNWMSVDVSNQPMNVDMGLRFPKLRLLMLLGLRSDISSEGIGDFDVSFEGIGDLNVLSFSDISIGSLPTTLGLLQNLRTLYLDSCKVEDISVIGELGGLEILYCHDCDEINELPAEIGRLNRLRLLELNECSNLKILPFGILSSLVRLEELKMLRSFDGWEAEENGKEKRNASIRELESLPNLTCLEIEISDSNLAAQQIRLSPNLAKYYICIGKDNYWDEDRYDYEKVMRLNLPSENGAVGKWIQILVKNTEYLFLQGDGSNNINLEECQDLRNLEISFCSTLKKVVKTKDCKSGIVFSMLETLRLEFIDNLEEIWDGTIILNQNNVSSLCNLKSVHIHKCSKLRYLFSVSVATTWISQLEKFAIIECEAMEQVFKNDNITYGCIEFPKLKTLSLQYLLNLTAFCQGFENIKFPNLTQMWIEELPKLGLNSKTGNDDTNSFHLLCNPKVEIGGLKTLVVQESFNNLKKLTIYEVNGIRSLISYSIAINLVSLQSLEIRYCEELVEVIEGNDDDKDVVDIKCLFPTLKTLKFEKLPKLRWFWKLNHILELPLLEKVEINDCQVMETIFALGSLNTPKLKELRLVNLPNLKAFCQGGENIKFPQLTEMWIEELPKLNSFCPLNSETPHDDGNPFHYFCNPKVEIGGLKTLTVAKFNYNNIRNIWCHQIPINFFHNLEKLSIYKINGIRSLMSYSIAKNLVSLRSLEIWDCEEMVDVIEGNDDDKDVVDIKCLFPTLKTLQFYKLPKLRRFWKLNQSLELPLLEEVRIDNCQVMETFTLGSLNTPNLMELMINGKEVYDMKNLNDILNHHIRIENHNTSMIEDYEDEYEEDEDEEDEDEDKNNGQGREQH